MTMENKQQEKQKEIDKEVYDKLPEWCKIILDMSKKKKNI